jgi:branched-chain amino acid aminotransferase
LDRGFLYGDAVYEVWRTYGGVVFAWEEHLDRLAASARALHLGLPMGPDGILGEMRRTAAAFRSALGFAGELYIRLQVTRGGGAIGLDTALADSPGFVILVQPCPETPPDRARDGLRLSVATGLRRNPVESLNPAWKTGNYLNNVLCLREARSRGADEVVMLNLAGEVTEAAVSNIAFVRDGALIAPPMSAGILGGITRRLLFTRIAKAAAVQAREEPILPAGFAGMDECMLMSTTKDITPVAAIDGCRFRVGPGTVTARLKGAFGDFARSCAAARPELKL